LGQIIENDFGHASERALRVIFQNEDSVSGAHFFHLRLQRRRDFRRRFVCDNGDALGGLQPETNANGITRARG
jgi:hypothetical protein